MTKIGIRLVKILIACLVCGFLLQQIGITANAIFAETGINGEYVFATINQAISYLLPLLVTGSLVVLPIWLALFLFRSPSE